MKKFLGEIRSTTANAVNSAVRQIDKTLTNDALPPQQQERATETQYLRYPAFATACSLQTEALTDSQLTCMPHCRLPVESAKKLRWFDNADLAKMSVQHVREKHLLLDTITALKKVWLPNPEPPHVHVDCACFIVVLHSSCCTSACSTPPSSTYVLHWLVCMILS